jgi:putative acetyltransferase
MEIREGGLDEPQVVGLLRFHFEALLANSPAES